MNKEINHNIRLLGPTVIILFLCASFVKKDTIYDFPPKKVTFFPERISKNDVNNFLLAPGAAYYAFQNIVVKDNGNREKYDLYVYVYDSSGNFMPRHKDDIFSHATGPRLHESTEDVRLSIYTMRRGELDTLLKGHTEYNFLIFEPRASPLHAFHVDYVIRPDDVVGLAFNKDDSAMKLDDGGYYVENKKFKFAFDYYYLNPSPPAKSR
jgi:hypothetical protein